MNKSFMKPSRSPLFVRSLLAGAVAATLAAGRLVAQEAPPATPDAVPAVVPTQPAIPATSPAGLPAAVTDTQPAATTTAPATATVPATQESIASAATQPTTAPSTGPAVAADTGSGKIDSGGKSDPRDPKSSRSGRTGGSSSSRDRTSGSDRSFDKEDKSALTESPYKLPAARPLDPKYSALISHNIFVKGRQKTEPVSTGVPIERPPVPAPVPRTAESGLVLRGVVVEDEERFAFIEDLDLHRMIKLRVGDKVARGKITALSLAELKYEMNGKVLPVEVGYSFEGVKMLPMAAPITATPVAATPAVPGTQPAGPAGGPPPGPFVGAPGTPAAAPGTPGAIAAPATGTPVSTGISADMLEKMRRRRMEEGGR